MVYKYLGWGITNENGVAKLDHDAQGQEIEHSYTGTGAGEIDVLASLDNPIVDGSIVSGTLPVLDTLLYDTGTDATHNIWTGDTSNLTRNSEYSRLEESASPTPTSINTVMPAGLWVLTMSIKRDGHYTNWNINILNNNVSVFGCATPTNDVWTDITLVYDGSFIYYFENGSTTPTKKTSVMLDETKNTVLRLQTPQNITHIDFKDLIVLREEMSNISIGSTTPIIQSGSTAIIKGSLYESGLLVQNATLDVYKNGTKVGTASTGDSGVASYTYTGVADGEVEFQFRYGSILSGIFVIKDAFYLDNATSDQTSNYFLNTNNNSLTYNSNGYYILQSNATGTEMYVDLRGKENLIKGRRVRFEADLELNGNTVSMAMTGTGITSQTYSTDGICYIEGDVPSTITTTHLRISKATATSGDNIKIKSIRVYYK